MFKHLLITLFICCQAPAVFSQTSDIPKPHKFVGYKIGADKQLFGWQTIYEYLKILDEKSEKVSLEELGRSTSGKPFIMLKISGVNNLKNIAKYRNLQKQAAQPMHLTERDIAQLTREKKAVVMAVFNSSTNGVASVQGVLEFVHRLITTESSDVEKILQNTILLLVPDLNPDGMQKIVEWYNNYLKTPHEGSGLPGLTHEYAGDEIHEDWLGLNLAETRMVATQLFNKWYPEIVISIHEAEQLPRILVETSAPGTYPELVKSFEKMPGFALNLINENNESAFFLTTNLHNQIYFSITAANTLYGTPLFYPTGSAATQKLPSLAGSTWQGGWWTMRDIIDTEITAVFSVLDWVAANKAAIIENFCRQNIELAKSSAGSISAYSIPLQQHDPSALVSMLSFLAKNDVRIFQLRQNLQVDNHTLSAMDYIIPRTQPVRNFIDYMLAEKPGNFDLPARYGLEVFELQALPEQGLTELKYIRKTLPIAAQIPAKGDYLISASSNDAYVLMNRAFNRKKEIFRFREEMKVGGNTFTPGTFYLPEDEIETEAFNLMMENLSLEVQRIDFDFKAQKMYRLRQPKIGIFQPWIPNSDEGWARYVLDQFRFLQEGLSPSKIRSGGIGGYDVLILPDMPVDSLVHGWANAPVSDFIPSMPRPYVDGLKKEGVENLQKYVKEGGTLILLGQTCGLAVNEFKLPLSKVSRQPRAGISDLEKIISVHTNPASPLAYGMPKKTEAIFTNGFLLQPVAWPGETEVAAHLINPVRASNGHNNSLLTEELPLVMKIPMGEGQIILMPIRPQYRAQTPATYKFLFNAILSANSEKVVL